jgi:hypothetical protein
MGDATATGGGDHSHAREYEKENGTHQKSSLPSFAAQP